MKKILMTLTFLCCILSIEAQTSFQKTKMSPWLYGKYQQELRAFKKNGGPKRVQGRTVRNYILALVKNTDEAAAVREAGGVVLQDFGNDICAAFLPIDKLGELDQNPHILQMEANAPSKLQNDTSAVILGTDKAWNGQGPASYSQPTPSLSQAFTGKGVFAAVMDIGFDFTHPAFRNADGTSRIKWFWDPMAPDANNDLLGMIYNSPTEVLIAQHSCDAFLENHGTHVMGSMAGAGLNGRYVGMAPEADILGFHMPIGGETAVPDDYWNRLADYLKSHSSNFTGLEDAIVKIEPSAVVELVGLHEIFKVADAAGQPCVVNWSFAGSPYFNFDTRLIEEVFDSMVGPGHIVVAAAGNNGYTMTYLAKAAGKPLDHEFYLSTLVGYSYMSMRTEADEPDFALKFAFDDRPTMQGRIKPDVVAPGFNIISCHNSFYHKADVSEGLVEDILPKAAYADKAFGRTYAMTAMSGTSMACPITAGVIALWLQAKPNLTPEDILGIIERTSHQPEPEFSGTDKNIYYGWGEIDAYAGLLDILGLTGIREISKHQPAGLKFRLDGRTLHIDGIDSSETVTMFDLSGCPVLRTETSSDGILSLSGLSAGVYAVQVGHRGSTLIRLSL